MVLIICLGEMFGTLLTTNVISVIQSIPEECSEDLNEQEPGNTTQEVGEIKIFPISDDEDDDDLDDEPFHGERGQGEGQEDKESCEDEDNEQDTDTLGKKKEDPEAIALKKRT